MNTDELEELLRKLLAKGVTVIVLVMGSTGQIGGTSTDPAQPPAVSVPSTTGEADPSPTPGPDRPGGDATAGPDTDPTVAPTPSGSTSASPGPDASERVVPTPGPDAQRTDEPSVPGTRTPPTSGDRSRTASPGATGEPEAGQGATTEPGGPGTTGDPAATGDPGATGSPRRPAATGSPGATGEPGAPADQGTTTGGPGAPSDQSRTVEPGGAGATAEPGAPAVPGSAGDSDADTGGTPARDRVLTVLPDGTWSGGTGSVGSAPGGDTGTDSRTDTGNDPRTGSGNDSGNGSGTDDDSGPGTGSRTDTGRTPDGSGPTDAREDRPDGAGGGTGSGTGDGTGDAADGTEDGSPGGDENPGEGSGDTTADSGEDGMSAAGQGVTAAEKLDWGNPVRSDDFTDGTEGWNIYDGPGHAGNGTRTPDAVSVQDGMLTITGDAEGNTAGMAWMPGQQYGRWEGRVKAPASDPSYNALLLLWPDAENFPEGGEVDFMEMMDPTRQKTNMFLHYGADNSQVSGEVEIDATEWHNWAVEWTPQGITAYVDGEQWWETTDTSILPPGPMHLCIQLDWFPKGGDVQESTMQVDWVKQYSLDGSEGGTGSGD